MKLKNICDYIRTREIVFLFIFIIIIYNINFRSIGSGDTIPASLMPFNILENHNLYFDNFVSYYHNQGSVVYYFWDRQGHTVSAYPIVTPLLITPLYILPYIILKMINCPIDLSNVIFNFSVVFMEKISASIITALSGLFIYLSLKNLFNRKMAFIGVIIYSLATSTWTISSQGLWQHGMGELILSVIIYLIIMNEKRPEIKNIVYLGALSALFIFNRPSDSALLLPVLFYVFTCKKFSPMYFFFAAFIIALPLLIYNSYFFGSIFGGYSGQLSFFNISNILVGILGLLVSPSRGLLIYTPIAILSIFGYRKIFELQNKRIRKLLYIFGLSIIIQISLYGSFGQWWGGCTYGPRFLTCILPILALYIIIYINSVMNSNAPRTKKTVIYSIIFLLVLFSLAVQIIGAFFYTNGGWTWDRDIGVKGNAIFWDWHDTQIMRSIQAGPGDFVFLNSFIKLFFTY